MTHKEQEPPAQHDPASVGEDMTETRDRERTQEIHMKVEIVDMRIEMIKHRKHEREMDRTLRWPIHSNTPRITF